LGATLAATTTVPKLATPLATTTPTISKVYLLVYISNSIPSSATVVNNLVAVTNQAYVDSNVNMKVIAAKVVTVTDPAPTNEYSALSLLQTGGLVFKTLSSDKTASQSDLVIFVHPLKVAQGMCGLGNLNGSYGQAFSKQAVYSVVSYGVDGNYYCNSWTFAHELGHTMGMVHDAAHSVGVVGHFTDSFGYGLQNAYGDIMSYFPANGVFSTPYKYWRNDSRFPYGVINKANVARGLNEVAPQVALFHTLTR
jgi:hypothetical protein